MTIQIDQDRPWAVDDPLTASNGLNFIATGPASACLTGGSIDPVHTLQLSAVTVDPPANGSEYQIGETPGVSVTAENTGNVVIDSFTVNLVHDEAPVDCEIYGVVVTPNTTAASIRWSIRNTTTGIDKPATGQVCYGTDPNNLNLETTLQSAPLALHVQNIPGTSGNPPLVPNTTYFYEIKSIFQGDLITSTGSFTTL